MAKKQAYVQENRIASVGIDDMPSEFRIQKEINGEISGNLVAGSLMGGTALFLTVTSSRPGASLAQSGLAYCTANLGIFTSTPCGPSSI